MILKTQSLAEHNRKISSPSPHDEMAQPFSQWPRLLRHVDWNHFRTFYVVATLKSFTKTAQYLKVSQPSLSRKIIAFENTLGKRLFVRGSRHLTLTRAGDLVYKQAVQSFQGIKTLLTHLQEEALEDYGDLTLWASSGFLHLYLMPYLPTFLQRYPNICLHLSSCKTIPALEVMETDVVIRPPFPNRPDLTQIPLFINHVKLYAHPTYLKAFGTPKTPQDLDDHRLIASGKPSRLMGFNAMNWHLNVGRPDGQERKAFIELDLPEDRLQLAAAGLGITTASQEHPGLQDYGLIEVLKELTDRQGPTVSYHYIYSTSLQSSKRIERLRDYLVECFTRDYGPPVSDHLQEKFS